MKNLKIYTLLVIFTFSTCFANYGYLNNTLELPEAFFLDRIQDHQSIAINLGAQEGSTALLMSKNFHHIIAVEDNPVLFVELTKNLNACENVTLCSTSIGKTTTFKQFVFDNIYANESLQKHKIGLIKCDQKANEENILEDILYFAYYNNCKVFISFHLFSWKTKKIDDLDYLFKFFNTNCPVSDICQYLRENPFASILFEPNLDAGTLIKRRMPCLIIGYNQYTYIKDMVEQLEKYEVDIIIADNASDFKPLLDYYEKDYKHTLLRQKTNKGHLVFSDEYVRKLTGEVFIVTDPDLKFNPNLPDNFIQELINISEHFDARKVGFALCIDADNLRTDIPFVEWETIFWKKRFYYSLYPSLEIYFAPVDTTFCLINYTKNAYRNFRVAGNFTCIHRPWHTNFLDGFLPEEYENYIRNNKSTNWFPLMEEDSLLKNVEVE
jgi:hypothetical protein